MSVGHRVFPGHAHLGINTSPAQGCEREVEVMELQRPLVQWKPCSLQETLYACHVHADKIMHLFMGGASKVLEDDMNLDRTRAQLHGKSRTLLQQTGRNGRGVGAHR